MLTPEHVGRFMRTRRGERAGPMEYDAGSFGFDSDKRWRAPIGTIRAYYSPDGRVFAGEESPDDIVGDWDA